MENKELKYTEISSADKLIEWLKMRIEVSHSSFDYIKFALTEYASLKNKALQEEHAETTERLADTCLQQARELISKDEEIKDLKQAAYWDKEARDEAYSKAKALQEENEKLIVVLNNINDIRNSIIGYQAVNWSAHIYPLVAALESAGIKGMGYEKACEMAKDQIARIEELQKLNKEYLEVLELALPYVKGAYECAFPDESENVYVMNRIQSLIQKQENGKR